MIMEIIVGRRAAVTRVGRNAAVALRKQPGASLGQGVGRGLGCNRFPMQKGPEAQAATLLSVL